jgi:hypothetical protein
VKASKMAVVFDECGRECLSGPGNTAQQQQAGRGPPVGCLLRIQIREGMLKQGDGGRELLEK